MNADGTFQLLDAIGLEIPTLETIAASLRPAASKIDVYFPSDKRNWRGEARPVQNYPPFMARGNFDLLPKEHFILTAMADF